MACGLCNEGTDLLKGGCLYLAGRRPSLGVGCPSRAFNIPLLRWRRPFMWLLMIKALEAVGLVEGGGAGRNDALSVGGVHKPRARVR